MRQGWATQGPDSFLRNQGRTADVIQIKATFGLLTILGSMDTYDAATARQKIELYREYLAKGVHGGMAVVYLVEIAKLELLLSQVEANSKQPDRLRR